MRKLTTCCACTVITLVGFFSTEAFGAVMSFRDAVMADNPYAYYRLGESSGTNAHDETTGNRDGTYLNGATLGVPGFGGDTAVLFDGSNDYVQVPGLAALGSSMTSFSIEAVFKTTSTQHASVTSSFHSTVSNSGFCMRINAGSNGGGGQIGGTAFTVRDDEGYSASHFITGNCTTDIYDADFHHVVMTYDSSGGSASNRLKAYIDGQQQTLSFYFTGTPSNFSELDQPVGIGATQGTPPSAANFFDGTIDEIAFYDTVLTPAQISAHYDATAVPEPSSFVLVLGLAGASVLWVSFRKRQSKTKVAA